MSKYNFLSYFNSKLYNKQFLFVSESTLQNHILKMHNNISLGEYPTSTFFNVIATIQSSSSKQTSPLKEVSAQVLPDDFFVYQCLNCRLFFASNCSFSHNCWTYTENNVSNGDSKQPPTNNNYFSPIFLKFNVGKLLNSRFYNSQLTSTNS